MTKKNSPLPSGREELADFLRELFGKTRSLLANFFERSRTSVRDYMEQKKVEGPNHRHKRWIARRVVAVLSHWHRLFEGFQDSPQRIYNLLEEAINKREIPDVNISRISYPEAGALSASREYFRVQRREHIFDICAAPFGTGFFISWWLGETRKFSWLLAVIFVAVITGIGLAIKLPWWLPLGIGVVIVALWRLSFRPTYYRLDTALMFQDSVHSAVLEVIGQATEGKGLRALSEVEKKPIMSDLFKRMVK